MSNDVWADVKGQFGVLGEKLKEADEEIKQLKQERTRAKYFLSLVMYHVGSLEIDMKKMFDHEIVDDDNVVIIPENENNPKAIILHNKSEKGKEVIAKNEALDKKQNRSD